MVEADIGEYLVKQLDYRSLFPRDPEKIVPSVCSGRFWSIPTEAAGSKFEAPPFHPCAMFSETTMTRSARCKQFVLGSIQKPPFNNRSEERRVGKECERHCK